MLHNYMNLKNLASLKPLENVKKEYMKPMWKKSHEAYFFNRSQTCLPKMNLMKLPRNWFLSWKKSYQDVPPHLKTFTTFSFPEQEKTCTQFSAFLQCVFKLFFLIWNMFIWWITLISKIVKLHFKKIKWSQSFYVVFLSSPELKA